MSKLINYFPEVDREELFYIRELTHGMNEEELESFVQIYRNKRQSAQTILIVTLIGFFGFAGIQRFMTGQVLLGVLYFLTAGLCFIGTIVDIVNHKKLALDYNLSVAEEAACMVDDMGIGS